MLVTTSTTVSRPLRTGNRLIACSKAVVSTAIEDSERQVEISRSYRLFRRVFVPGTKSTANSILGNSVLAPFLCTKKLRYLRRFLTNARERAAQESQSVSHCQGDLKPGAGDGSGADRAAAVMAPSLSGT